MVSLNLTTHFSPRPAMLTCYVGLQIQNYLDYNTADLSAVSENGTTYVYHYATINQTANVGIHELTINRIPGSFTNQESYNLSEPLVFSPNLTSANNEQSAFQPLTATKTVVPGVAPGVLVFWAGDITGDPNTLSGYHSLLETNRQVSSNNWPNSQPIPIPLGTSNTFPSVSTERRSLHLKPSLRWRYLLTKHVKGDA